MTSPLPLVSIHPATGVPHSHTAICLHGRGSSARSFSTSLLQLWTDAKGRTLQHVFPSFRWVFPQAAKPGSYAVDNPVVLPPDDVRYQWFDIWDKDDPASVEEVQAERLRESVAAIRDAMSMEVENLGGRWERIVLIGFSQGGATAAHALINLRIPASVGAAGLRHDDQSTPRLGAFLGLPCRMPFPGRTLDETRAVLGLTSHEGGNDPNDDADVGILGTTPVLLEHCADDKLVEVEEGRTLHDTLTGFGASVAWREYSEGGHWFNSPAGLDDAVEFLRTHVPGVATNARS